MIKYNPQNQIEIFEFEHPFETELDKDNRWVKLAKYLPWDKLVGIYSQALSAHSGRYGIDGRLAVGSLIIKHRLGLSDREVIEILKENIYLQFFVGMKKFTTKAAFDPSLFVELRKRMGAEKFDEMSQQIIKLAEKKKTKPTRKQKKDADSEDQTPEDDNSNKNTSEISPKPDKSADNQGTLKLDATVADQKIAYPTDHGLLNKAREESERLIDILYSQTTMTKKPRTYRRNARKDYVNFSKKKAKTSKQIRKAVGKQLRYLRRNIKSIHTLLDVFEGHSFPLNKHDQRTLWIIQTLYDQQQEMHSENKHSVKDRIVNIHQPHVRPIPRGKDKAQTEFGAKIGVSEVNGFSRINHLSWDAYNETTDLQPQVEEFRRFYGHYPEVVLADNIYLSRENRKYLKQRGIRITGKRLGRPPENETYYQKSKRKKEHNQRNHIEGKFGQGKNAYGLSKIAAKTRKTSESWISGIFFVMNLVKVQQTLMLLWFIWGVFFWLHYFRDKFFSKKSNYLVKSWSVNLNYKFVV